MRVLFCIPKNPPPRLAPKFSQPLQDFVSVCLQMDALKVSAQSMRLCCALPIAFGTDESAASTESAAQWWGYCQPGVITHSEYYHTTVAAALLMHTIRQGKPHSDLRSGRRRRRCWRIRWCGVRRASRRCEPLPPRALIVAATSSLCGHSQPQRKRNRFDSTATSAQRRYVRSRRRAAANRCASLRVVCVAFRRSAVGA